MYLWHVETQVLTCVADKAQTGERSRNADGTLSGADRSTAKDAEFWDQEDVYRYIARAMKICILTLSRQPFIHLIEMFICTFEHISGRLGSNLVMTDTESALQELICICAFNAIFSTCLGRFSCTFFCASPHVKDIKQHVTCIKQQMP